MKAPSKAPPCRPSLAATTNNPASEPLRALQMSTPLTTALLALAIANSSLAQEAGGPSPWFEEVSGETELIWQHVSGASTHPGTYWFPEIMGGGVALFDYDRDGDLDIYLVQSGILDPAIEGERPGNKLFKNTLIESRSEENPAGTLAFVDVTTEAGVGDTGYGMGVACGDYDQDGDVDLYVTNVGANVLYENQGNGKFRDVTTRLKVGDGRWGTSAAFLDADQDGDLDLFLVNNLNWSPAVETPCVNYRNQPDYCSPENYNARSADALFLQGGRLGFQDYSRKAGLALTVGNGLGVCVADYDRNGLPDVYIANDATPNALWKNLDGKKAFSEQGLQDVALRSGCAVNSTGTPEAGMGVQWVDVNQDGWLDIFMTHIRRETNTFYLNNGRGRFRDTTRMTGLGTPSTRFTGFGMGFHDYDQDGVLDLYVANGAVQAWGTDEAFDPKDPYAEPNQLFVGLGDTKFDYVGEGTGQPVLGSSRGAAFGDLDQDGDVDIVVVDRDSQVKLLRNIAPKKGSWIGFDVQNRKRAAALGTMVKLETQDSGGEVHAQWRLVDPAYSYLASNDPRVVFGVPEGHEVKAVELWTMGAEEPRRLEEVSAGKYQVVR